MRRPLLALVLCAAGLGAVPLAVGAPTSIRAIVDHPDDYANQVVTVIGTVTSPGLGYRGESFYTLRAEDRRINVVSHQSSPTDGDRLEVRAKVGRHPPDEEFDFPPVLVELDRQPAP